MTVIKKDVIFRTKCIIVLTLIFEILIVSSHESPSSSKSLKIAVIGAGPAGLTSAKNALEQGHNVVIYEKGEAIGGIWFYTDKTGKDEYGVDIHTAMYQGVRTIVPYQLMEFPGHTFPNSTPSYPSHEDVWKYLNSYADRFSLRKHIKLHHLVEKVHSIENNKWNITVKVLPNNDTESVIYDAVFVCINIYSSPNYPQIERAHEFKGNFLHSHDYRRAEVFRGADVLVIGNGASGNDIVLQLSKTANRVTWSRHKLNKPTEDERKEYGKNVTFQNNVKFLTTNGAEFLDGMQQNFTVIIYATGYNASFSILDADTGIHVHNNYVQPLYKQILNIEHPTMAFIGLFVTFNLMDLQARFALKFILGAKKLPSKSEMLKDMQDYAESQLKKGLKVYLVSAGDRKEYYGNLARIADIAKISDVYTEIFIDSQESWQKDPFGYRNDKYTIIDDETFIKERGANGSLMSFIQLHTVKSHKFTFIL
ncbi:senecionine N-oxygenase-like [Contarinia nasturtii]|uniref:senecionine N-oxygenase-like n=1 Tax=Contarinia nasturtii TaxID=265458 RepID=UPI0012D3B794|nr:senecionine N-oxygenase-like [Contarinia nasturtii]